MRPAIKCVWLPDGLTYDYICFTDTGFQVTYNSTYVYIGNRRSTTYTYLVLR